MIQLMMIGKLKMTEHNNNKEYEDYVDPVKVKQLDDISAEVEDENNVDVNTKLIIYGVKTLCFRIFSCKSSS